jgi:hypothetical protein
VVRSAAGKRRGVAVAALLCSAWSAGAGAACSSPWLAASAGLEHSRWDESGAQGRALLHEAGTLRTLGLGVGGQCWDAPWQASVQQGRGTRQYRGVTVSNAPVDTESAITQYRLEFSALQPLGPALAAGARLGYHRIHRQIASAGVAQGYPERYTYWQAAAGAQLALHQGDAWQLVAQAWLGGGPPGRLQLQLPHADTALLRLGSSRLQQIGLTLLDRAPADTQARWHWVALLDFRRERFGAGPAQVVKRQGVPIGGAAQPATRQLSSAIAVTVQHPF